MNFSHFFNLAVDSAKWCHLAKTLICYCTGLDLNWGDRSTEAHFLKAREDEKSLKLFFFFLPFGSKQKIKYRVYGNDSPQVFFFFSLLPWFLKLSTKNI